MLHMCALLASATSTKRSFYRPPRFEMLFVRVHSFAPHKPPVHRFARASGLLRYATAVVNGSFVTLDLAALTPHGAATAGSCSELALLRPAGFRNSSLHSVQLQKTRPPAWPLSLHPALFFARICSNDSMIRPVISSPVRIAFNSCSLTGRCAPPLPGIPAATVCFRSCDAEDRDALDSLISALQAASAL